MLPRRKGEAYESGSCGMTWLLEMLFDSLRTMCAQFVVDMMDMATGVFTDLLSCDLSLFEGLFSVAGTLYRNAILPMSIAFLIVICIWQLLKTMFGGAGTAIEEPVELVGRSMLCLFLILNCKNLVDYLLNFAGTPYSWIVGSDIKIESFSGFVSASELAAAALGIDTLSLQLLLLILQIVVAWNYFKLLFVVAERYVLLGIFSYTAPLAFATGGAKATNNILANWAKMFGGQLILIILDAWGLKMYLSAYGNLLASRHGFTRFFVGCLCLVGFCRIMQKLDSYLASLGLSMGRTSPGMSGTALAIMAGRMLGRAGGYENRTFNSGSPEGGKGKTGKSENRPFRENDFAMYEDPIPMSGRNVSEAAPKEDRELQPGWEKENRVGGQHRENTVQNTGDERLNEDENTGMGAGEEGLREQSGLTAADDNNVWMKPEEEVKDPDMDMSVETDREMDAEALYWTEGYDTGILSSEEEMADEGKMETPGIPSFLQGNENGETDPGSDQALGNTESEEEKGGNYEIGGLQPAECLPSTLVEQELGDTERKTGESIQSEPALSRGALFEGAKSESEKETPVVVEQTGMESGVGSHGSKHRFTKNGRLYLATDQYEAPEVPYQINRRNGANYYTVPAEAASGGVRAVLQEDGSIRYSRDSKNGWEPKLRQNREQVQEPMSCDLDQPI